MSGVIGSPFTISLRLYVFKSRSTVNENHPVLLSLSAELTSHQAAYTQTPNEQTRYQVVRLESLIQQWAPQRAIGN